MSDFERPAWLEKALAERPSARFRNARRQAGGYQPPAVGQVRVIQYLDPNATNDRLGLIVGIEEDLGVVRILLLSPLAEYRAAADYLLEPVDSGSSMRLIVECDLRGAVWYPSQLGGCVGTCDPDFAAALDAVGGGALPEDVGLAQARFGLPARDDRDPRWAWKLAEFDELTSLTHECEESLLSAEPVPSVFDLALLQQLADLSVITPEIAMTLTSFAVDHDTGMTGDPESLEALLALMDKVDPGVQAVLMAVQERELARLSQEARLPLGNLTAGSATSGREASRRTLAAAVVARAGEAHACATVITSRRVWPTEASGVLSPGVASLASARTQISPIDFFSAVSEVAA